MVDGEYSTTIPEAGNYLVTVTCDNGATGEWNYSEWGPNIRNITVPKTKCSLDFTTSTEPPEDNSGSESSTCSNINFLSLMVYGSPVTASYTGIRGISLDDYYSIGPYGYNSNKIVFEDDYFSIDISGHVLTAILKKGGIVLNRAGEKITVEENCSYSQQKLYENLPITFISND